MKTGLTLLIVIAIAAFVYAGMSFSSRTAQHTALTESQGTTASTSSAASKSASFFSFFSSFFSKSDAEKVRSSEIIEYKRVASVDIDEIRHKASLLLKPYSTEDERDEVLRRFEETEELFEEWISITEKNIAKAESAGTKSREEIEEAKEALREMRNGRGFIAQRMQMVKNDSLQ